MRAGAQASTRGGKRKHGRGRTAEDGHELRGAAELERPALLVVGRRPPRVVLPCGARTSGRASRRGSWSRPTGTHARARSHEQTNKRTNERTQARTHVRARAHTHTHTHGSGAGRNWGNTRAHGSRPQERGDTGGVGDVVVDEGRRREAPHRRRPHPQRRRVERVPARARVSTCVRVYICLQTPRRGPHSPPPPLINTHFGCVPRCQRSRGRGGARLAAAASTPHALIIFCWLRIPRRRRQRRTH